MTATAVVALSACTTSRAPVVSVPSIASPAPPGAPAYYVVVAGLDVVVRASGNGHVTGSVAIPETAGNARAYAEGEVFGGLDDRHFVIVFSRGGDLPGVEAATLFMLTVSADGRPGRLERLDFDNQGVPVTGAALSPDGTTVVLSLTNELPGQAQYGSVVLINVLTGATRTWTGQGAPGYWPGVPSWAGDGTVEVPWWHGGSAGTVPASLTGVRELNLASPGGSLLAAQLVTYPAPVQGLESALIAPGSGYVVASSCRAGPGRHTGTAQIIELSPATGQMVKVLRTQTTRFGNNADIQDAISSNCRVLSPVDGGGVVLAQAFAFGRIDNGVFTSLPGTSPHILPVSAAW
ncbi:MAG: hypothetical protein ACRDOU_08290 [Streptosporangiaceae bacterium]